MIPALKTAAMSWRRQPIVPMAIILSLAVGSGMLAAVYGVLEAVVLRPFPYRDVQELVFIWGSPAETIRRGLAAVTVFSWRRDSEAFTDIALFLPTRRVSVGEQGEEALMSEVEPRLFSVLGVRPSLGRFFDESPGDTNAIVLSYGAWQKWFAGSDNVLASVAIIDRKVCQVVGVMPPGFFFPGPDVQLWFPVNQQKLQQSSAGEMMYLALGRLTRGTTPRTAQAELQARMGGRRETLGVFPVNGILLGDYPWALWTLLAAATAFVLLVWANVAMLSAARNHDRQKELAIRAAVGASRLQILIGLMTEHLVLSVTGGVAGLCLAGLCLALIHRMGLVAVPRMAEARVGWWSVGLAAIVALASAPVITILAGRPNHNTPPMEPLSGQGIGGRGRRRGVFRGLVLLQLAVVPCLLLVAALFATSFIRRARLDWGEPGGIPH